MKTMSTFREIDYLNMPDDNFKHLYVDSIVDEDKVWGCVPAPAFDRVCGFLSDLGFENVEIQSIIKDPEVVETYVVTSLKKQI